MWSTFILVLPYLLLIISKLLYRRRVEKCAALIQAVRESPAVIDKGRDMVEVKRIRTKDIPVLQEHLTVIMQTIKKEESEFTPNSLEISLVKIRRKYCVMIDYFHLKQELSEFEKERQQVRRCIRELSEVYEVKEDSGAHWECSKVFLPNS